MTAHIQHEPSARRCGQALIEYVTVLGMLLAAVAIMWVLSRTFQEFGDRTVNLVASEYP